MAEQVFQPIQLIKKQTIADNVLELRFTKPAGFSFIPGQFVQFQIPEEGRYVLRSYSISSTSNDPYLEFCIKLIPDGKASQFFDAIVFGNTVYITNAKGRFVCGTVGPNYFVATGAGLAPIMSMVSALPSLPGTNQVLFGVRHETDIFWQDRLGALRAKGVATAVTLSRPASTWKGLTGRVTDHVVPDPTGHYYVCGSLEMVKDVRAQLVANGVDINSIHLEIF